MRNQVGKAVQNYADQAAGMVQDQYDHVVDQVESGYRGARKLVKTRPIEAVGVTFAAGMIAGALLAYCTFSSENR